MIPYTAIFEVPLKGDLRFKCKSCSNDPKYKHKTSARGDLWYPLYVLYVANQAFVHVQNLYTLPLEGYTCCL